MWIPGVQRSLATVYVYEVSRYTLGSKPHEALEEPLGAPVVLRRGAEVHHAAVAFHLQRTYGHVVSVP